MRFRALVRQAYSTLRFVVRQIPAAFTLVERLFVYRFRYREAGDHSAGFEKVRLQLASLEPRLVPSGSASIGDYVWYDTDRDGVQDIDESGAAGITVTLTGGSLTAAQTQSTDFTGHYDFTGLDAGTYTLDFAAPPGYGFSTPSGGQETLSVASGATVTTADAGLVPPPLLTGEAIVAVKGYQFSGTVAQVATEGTIWTAGDLDATIEWGDGTSSAGTLVSTGSPPTSSLWVVGDHTYTHEGAYALAVKVSDPSIAGVKNFVADLAYVLAPTDHQQLETIGSASVTVESDDISGYDATLTGTGGFTAQITGEATYTLTESGNEVGDSFSLTRTGTINFSLGESGSDFSQPDSNLSLSLSESSTKHEVLRSPDQYGTGVHSESLNYTLSQTGSGADYLWNTTNGVTQTDDNQTVTVSDGTLSSSDLIYGTLIAQSGENNASGSSYWMSSSGSDTLIQSDSGYHGPVSLSNTRNATGPVTVSESGGFWDYSFVRGESHTGTYTLTESSSNPGGTHTASGTGSYSNSLSGNGTDPGGSVTYVTSNSDSGYTGTATDSQMGIVSTALENRSDSDTKLTTGSESTGVFTLTHTTGNGSTATATTTNQGVTSTQTTTASNSNTTAEIGTTGVGAYTLTGSGTTSNTVTGTSVYLGESASWGSSSGSTLTSTQNGDRIAGNYTLTQTATSTNNSSDGTTQTAVQTGSGVTGKHARGSSDGGTQIQSTTDTWTVSLAGGAYSLHEASTSTTTANDSASDDTDSTGTLGSTADNDESESDRQTITGTSTLDKSGNLLTGTYSLHQVSSSCSTATDGSTDDVKAIPGDGENDDDLTTDASTSYQTSGSTMDRTGNEVSGTYSEHVVDSTTITTYGTSTDSVNDHAANGSTDDDVNVDLSTAYQISTTTTDRTGNADTGTYGLTTTEVDTGSEFDADSDTITDDEADGEDDEELDTDNSSAYQTSTATTTGSGNDFTSAYSRFMTQINAGSSFETGTTTATDDLADGSVDTDRDVEQDTLYQSGTQTINSSGNDVTGSFYQLDQDTENDTDLGTGTDTPTDSPAGGGEIDDVFISLRSAYRTTGDTLTNFGNFISGDYTKHEVTSDSGSDYSTDTDTTTDHLRDTSEDDDVDASQDTTFESGNSTADATGNEVSGGYSLHEIDGSSQTEYGTDTDTSTNHPADGSTASGLSTKYDQQFASSGEVLDRFGNGLTGFYSMHETSSDFNTDSLTDSDTGSDLLADGSTDYDTESDSSTDSETDDSTVDQTGDDVTGEYSALETDSDSESQLSTITDSVSDSLAGGDSLQDGVFERISQYRASGSIHSAVGNGINGVYSQHETDSSSATNYEISTDTATDTLRDGSVDDPVDIEEGTAYPASSATEDMTGNVATGSYSEHEISTSSASEFMSGTNISINVLTDGSTINDLMNRLDQTFQNGSAVLDRFGNEVTGSYSLHETETNSESDYVTDSDNATDQMADDSTAIDTESDSETQFETSDPTQDRIGNAIFGNYSQHEVESDTATGTETESNGSTEYLVSGGSQNRANNNSASNYIATGLTIDKIISPIAGTFSIHELSTSTSTEYGSDTDIAIEDLTGDPAENEMRTDLSSVYHTSGSTRDESGSDITGIITDHETDSSTSTTSGSATDSVMLDGDTTTQTNSDNATVFDNGNETQIENAITGDYTTYETGTFTPTDSDNSTDQGLSGTGTTTGLDTWTLSESGNEFTGAYTTTQINTHDATTPISGTDARGTYTGTETDHSTSTNAEHGNNIGGTHTDVVMGTSDSTVTTTGGDVSTSYSRTEIASDSSSTSQTWSDDTDVSSQVAMDINSSTVYESGTTVTTDYSFAEVDGSTTTDTDTSNSVSGMDAVTHTASSTSSLHEQATESGSGEYTIDKVTGNTANTTRIADAETGDYTLSGVTGMTSTAIESNTHGAYSAHFTEILTEDPTLDESGNDLAGQDLLSESGTRTANFVDDGTDAGGSFHVTETSTGTYDRTTTGDSNNGATQIDETSRTDYSVNEIISGTNAFTLTENGTDAMTTVEMDDTVTGDDSIAGNGTDLYTLDESGTLGGAFSDSVTGTDVYASTETGNNQQQTYDRTTTGGGDWTRVATGGLLASGSGTNTYTLTESGDQAAGHFSQSVTGTDRYGLVEQFDDVSNTSGGSTPGNVTLHSHGLAWKDPVMPADGDPLAGSWEASVKNVEESMKQWVKSFKTTPTQLMQVQLKSQLLGIEAEKYAQTINRFKKGEMVKIVDTGKPKEGEGSGGQLWLDRSGRVYGTIWRAGDDTTPMSISRYDGKSFTESYFYQVEGDKKDEKKYNEVTYDSRTGITGKIPIKGDKKSYVELKQSRVVGFEYRTDDAIYKYQDHKFTYAAVQADQTPVFVEWNGKTKEGGVQLGKNKLVGGENGISLTLDGRLQLTIGMDKGKITSEEATLLFGDNGSLHVKIQDGRLTALKGEWKISKLSNATIEYDPTTRTVKLTAQHTFAAKPGYDGHVGLSVGYNEKTKIASFGINIAIDFGYKPPK